MYTFNEISADFQKVLRRYMDISSRFRNFVPLIGLIGVILCGLDPILPWLLEMLGAKKRRFKRVRILYAEFFEQDYSGSSIFVFFKGHFAIVGAENRTEVDNAFWNVPYMLIGQPDRILFAEVPASIHKNVHVSAVTVHIAGKDDSTRVWIRLIPKNVVKFDKRFCVVYCWVQKLAGILPTTIEVDTHQRRSIVSMNYAVGVQNRQYLENESISEFYGHRIIWENEFDAALDHILWVGFTGMHSRRHEYILFVPRVTNFFLCSSHIIGLLLLLLLSFFRLLFFVDNWRFNEQLFMRNLN